MNRKTKVIVIIASILLAAASFWYFFADDLFLFILSRAIPPAEPMPVEQRMPCDGNPASFVELGSPYLTKSTAEFTTAGGEIYVIAQRYEHGILLPERRVTAIYIGHYDTPPTWDSPKNIVSNIYKKTSVWEKDYGALTLPAGRYWLLVKLRRGHCRLQL